MPYTLPNITNSSNAFVDLIKYESGQIPILWSGILFFFFFVIMGAGFFSQERRTGRGNLPMWLTISGFITTVGAFILLLIGGLVSIEIVGIFIVISTMSALWFFLTPDD